MCILVFMMINTLQISVAYCIDSYRDLAAEAVVTGKEALHHIIIWDQNYKPLTLPQSCSSAIQCRSLLAMGEFEYLEMRILG
jgi:hypothetical protein